MKDLQFVRRYEILKEGKYAGECRIRSDWTVVWNQARRLWLAENTFGLFASGAGMAELRAHAEEVFDAHMVRELFDGLVSKVGVTIRCAGNSDFDGLELTNRATPAVTSENNEDERRSDADDDDGEEWKR
jgi:hypothetical protein